MKKLRTSEECSTLSARVGSERTERHAGVEPDRRPMVSKGGVPGGPAPPGDPVAGDPSLPSAAKHLAHRLFPLRDGMI